MNVKELIEALMEQPLDMPVDLGGVNNVGLKIVATLYDVQVVGGVRVVLIGGK